MKGKKLISIFAVMALIAALLTTSAFALEENPEDRANASSSYAETASADAGETTEKSEKLRAYLEGLMEKKNEEENGETVRKDVLSDGTVLYISVIDKEETPQQGGRFPTG